MLPSVSRREEHVFWSKGELKCIKREVSDDDKSQDNVHDGNMFNVVFEVLKVWQL